MAFINFDEPAQQSGGFIDFDKPESEQSGDTVKGFKRAFAQVPEFAYGTAALASMSAEHLFGEGGLSTAAKDYFGQKFAEKQQANQQYAPSVEFTDAWENLKTGDLGSMADWLQDSAGYVAGQVIQTAVTGGVGAFVGKAGLSAATQKMLGGVVAKQATKIAEESVAKQGLTAAAAELAVKAALPEATKIAAQRTAQAIGAGIALQAQNLGMEAGDIYGGLTEEAEKTGKPITGDDLLRAWGAAAAAAGTKTATDLLGLGAVTGRLNIGKMTGLSGRAARAGVAAGVGMPIEAGQEYIQTGLEQYGAGKKLGTPEAERERINAAAVGGLGGAVVGGGAGLISSAQKAAPAPVTGTGSEPSSSPVRSTLTVEQNGKRSTKTTHEDGSIDIDGVQVAPPGSAYPPALDPADPVAETLATVAPVLNAGTLEESIQAAATVASQSSAIDEAILAAQVITDAAASGQPITRDMVEESRAAEIRARNLPSPLTDGVVAEQVLLTPSEVISTAQNAPEMGTTVPNIGTVALSAPAETIMPKIVGGIPVSAQSTEQLRAIRDDQNANANSRRAAGETVRDREQNIANPDNGQVSAPPIAPNVSQLTQNEPLRATNETIAPAVQESDLFKIPEQPGKVNADQVAGAGKVIAVDKASAEVDKASAEVDKGLEVERFQGQYKKGLSERNARAMLPNLAKKSPNLAWTVEKTTVPEFPDRFDIVGRKPAESPTAAQPAAPALSAAPESVIDQGESTPAESVPNRSFTNTQNLADLVETKSFRAHGLSGLDAPSKRIVLSIVFNLAHDNKILNAVIPRIPVDVMDNLGRQQLTPEMLLHNQAMLQDFLSGGRIGNLNVSDASVSDVVRAFASVAAKEITTASGLSPIPDNSGTAGSALNVNRLAHETGRAISTTEGKASPVDALGRTKKHFPAESAGKIGGTHDVTPNSDVVTGAGGAETSPTPNIIPETVRSYSTQSQPANSESAKLGGYPVSGMGEKALKAYAEKSADPAHRKRAQDELDRRKAAEPAKEAAKAVEEPQHIESGETEEATPEVIRESVAESAANTPMDFRQARDKLLTEIDAAIKQAPQRIEEGKRRDERTRKKDEVKSLEVFDAKRDRWITRREGDYADVLERKIGYVRFDVPGDGTFKVLNLSENLQEFRKSVAREAGFKPLPKKRKERLPEWKRRTPGDPARLKELEAEHSDAAFEAAEKADAKAAAKIADEKEARVAEIDAELAKLQAQYEKKSKGGKLGGMVPPAVKTSALKSITDKMDKLDAEKAKLLKAAAPTKPAVEPASTPEAGIPVSAEEAPPEPAPAAEKAPIAAEKAADNPMAAAAEAIIAAGEALRASVAKPSATPAPEGAPKRSEATTAETKPNVGTSKEVPPILSGKEGGIADKNIQDFGEKIEGARKDYAAKLEEAKSADVAAVPLSQSWPEPDYAKLLESGADPWGVAFMHAARDEIPTKPSQSWKLRRWVDQVELLRNVTMGLLDGTMNITRAKQLMDEGKSFQSVRDRTELYQEVGHEKSLKGVRISEGVYSLYNKVEYNPPKVIWSVEGAAVKTAMSRWPKMLATGDTREQAIANFKKVWLETTPEQDAAKSIDFQIYSKRSGVGEKQEVFIGKKIGSNVAELKGGFTNAKDARAWRDAHQTELVAMLEKYKDVPYERKESNSPRVGIYHRNGANVTPEQFTQAFGFRGVQFGNYVEGGLRQQDLNEAYDALMDLAGVLGIPSKAISLNGELGLAFGARGTGGKRAPSAHYEPGQVVINLTKARGAGSLAHEWFHAVDNYFSRMAGAKSLYMTETPGAKGNVRTEMVDAFNQIRSAIRKTDLIKRSQRLDQTRSKPYWSTGLEMAARSFETYIVAKLQDQNASNDYLANIVSEDYWQAATALGIEKDNTFPYPTTAEMTPIRAAFDHFFQTIETRETDKGTALYSRTDKGVSALSTGIITPEVQALNDKMAVDLKDEKWRNAYALAQPGTARTDIAAAIKAAFGKDTVFIAHTIPEGSGFEGMSYGGKIYVNVANERHGFVNILGHELLHELKRDRPDLYRVLATKATQYTRPGAEDRYARTLAALGGKREDVPEEAIADFTGDALADPNFLKALAEQNPSKFKQLLTTVVSWLERVATKLYGKGFRSSEYFTDVNALKDYLSAVLRVYAEQNNSSAIDGVEQPQFSRSQDQTQTGAFRTWSNNASVVSAEQSGSHTFKTGVPVVGEAFHGTNKFGFTQFKTPSWFSTNPDVALSYSDESLARLGARSTPLGDWFSEREAAFALGNRLTDGTKYISGKGGFAEKVGDEWRVSIKGKKISVTSRSEAVQALFNDAVKSGAEMPGIYRVYVNLQNPKVYRDYAQIEKSFPEATMPTEVAASRAKDAGYDGMIIRNIANAGKFDVTTLGELTGTEYVAFYPAQIKAVFNDKPTNNPDIRFARNVQGGLLNNVSDGFESDPSPDEANKVQAGIEGKSAREAALFIAKTAPSRDYRLIAYRVARQLRRMEAAGLQIAIKVAHLGEEAYTELAGKMKGVTWRSWDSKVIDIWIQGADVKGLVGTSYETVLHELLHAVTQSAIYVGKNPGNTAMHKDVEDLYRVNIAIVQHIQGRITKAGGDVNKLDSFIEKVFAQGHNSLREPGEVLSWALTNRRMQDYLESVPYKGGTLWSRFVSAIRKVLGLPAHSETALSEILRITDSLLDSPVQQLLTITAPTRINYNGGLMNAATAVQGGAMAWNPPNPSKLDNLIYTLQDKQVDTRRVLQAIREAGKQVGDALDVYLQEELFHGRAAKETQLFIDDELKPLITEMAARKVTMAEFEEYLHARHAEEANIAIAARNPKMPDGGSGMDTADAQAYLATLDPAKKRAYEALAKRIDAINDATRQLLVDAELESQDTIDTWKAAYQHYVPLHREDMGGGPGIGQGFSVRGPASKMRTGSSRTVVDILGNIAIQREKAILRSEKDTVSEALYGLAKENPNPEFWKLAKPGVTTSINAETGDPVDVIDMSYQGRDNVVMHRSLGKDGKIVQRGVEFNEHNERALRMAMALKNLDANEMGEILSASAKVTRYFASVNTQYNPIFGVVNLTRDSQQAMFNLSTTPIAGKQAEVAKHILSALKGIYLDLRAERSGQHPTSVWAQLFEEFQKEGGQTGYRDMFRTGQDRAAAIQRALDPTGWMNSPLGKIFTAGGMLKVPLAEAQKKAGAVFDWLSDYNAAMENSVRLAAYKVGKDSGMTNQRAASMAKNLTVNFNRKGQITTQAGALYAFFNASVQGSTRLIETLNGPMGRKIIVGGITLGAIQALALAAAGFDEDEPPQFIRERSTIIPIGGKKYITIPMPLGLHFIPNIGRIATEFVLSGFRDPGKRVSGLLDVFTDAFNPVGSAGLSLQTITPTAIDPLAALAENRDWTGKPIEREDMSQLSPTPGHTRAKDTASAFSKGVSRALNYASGGTDYKPGLFSPTPDQIDYLIGQATGGLGREAMKVEQSIGSVFTGEDLPTYKIPLAGRFYGDAEQQSSQGNAYYSNLKKLNEHEAEIKGRRKAGEPLGDYLKENPEARLFQMANATERQVSALRKQKRALIAKDASPDVIKAKDAQITARMKLLNDRVKQVSAQGQ